VGGSAFYDREGISHFPSLQSGFATATESLFTSMMRTFSGSSNLLLSPEFLELQFTKVVCYYICCYNNMNFEWDEGKNRINIDKHGISFRDIVPVFVDWEQDGLLIEDIRQSYGEDRFILFHFFASTLLCVVFTWREDNIRIISARRANRREMRHYEQRRENSN
jgi:hypothetical protein